MRTVLFLWGRSHPLAGKISVEVKPCNLLKAKFDGEFARVGGEGDRHDGRVGYMGDGVVVSHNDRRR